MLSSKANEKDDKSPDQTSSPKPSEIIEDKEMQGSTSAADPSNPLPLSPKSSGQVNHQEPAAAQVKYDFLFKKKLCKTDVNRKLLVPNAEAVKHFGVLPPGRSFNKSIEFHDVDQGKTREFELAFYRNYNVYSLAKGWKDYSTENQLQEGDTVMFSKIVTEQPPHYAVQIKRGSSQVGHEEAAGVKYNYGFKKQLCPRDVKYFMTLPKAEADIHFRRNNVLFPDGFTMVHVYDINRERTMRWKFVRRSGSSYFNGDWKQYVQDNQLQRGDTVLFYKIGSGQGVNNMLQPPYAVQFEKSGTHVDTVNVNVASEKLAVCGVNIKLLCD